MVVCTGETCLLEADCVGLSYLLLGADVVEKEGCFDQSAVPSWQSPHQMP